MSRHWLSNAITMKVYWKWLFYKLDRKKTEYSYFSQRRSLPIYFKMLRLLDIENAKAISRIQLNRFVEFSSEIPSHDTKCKLFRPERIQPDDIITIWSCPVWSSSVVGWTVFISASVRGNNRLSVYLIFRFSETVLSSFPLRRLRSFEMARKGKHCCPFKKVKISAEVSFFFVPRFESCYLITPFNGPGQIFERNRANSVIEYDTVCCSKSCTVLWLPCKLKDGSVRDPYKFLSVQKFVRTLVKGVL